MDIDEFNVKIDTDPYGTIELLPGLSLNSMTWLHQPEIKALSAREFVVQLLQSHLVSPALDLSEIRAWPDDLLAQVASNWFSQQQEEPSSQTPEPFSWEAFRTSIYAQDAAWRQRLKATTERLLGPAIQQQISSMLKPILQTQAQMAGALSTARLISERLRPISLNLGPIYSMQQQVETIGRFNQLWRSLANPVWSAPLSQLVLPDIQGALQAHARFIASLTAGSSMYGLVFKQITEGLHRQWEWVPVAIRKLKREYQERVLTAFCELDLWPAPSMKDAFLERLVAFALDGNHRAVRLSLWNYYMRPPARRLETMVAGWAADAEFAARKPILDQAVTAHQNKLYAVAIPALLSQVEGIASDFAYRAGLLTNTRGGMQLGKTGRIVQGVFEVTGQVNTCDEDDFEAIEFVAVSAVIQYVQQVAFENLDFLARYEELRQRRALNRHAILHGIQINYSSALNSLRCFLLLDALYGFRNQTKGAEGAA